MSRSNCWMLLVHGVFIMMFFLMKLPPHAIFSAIALSTLMSTHRLANTLQSTFSTMWDTTNVFISPARHSHETKCLHHQFLHDAAANIFLVSTTTPSHHHQGDIIRQSQTMPMQVLVQDWVLQMPSFARKSPHMTQ